MSYFYQKFNEPNNYVSNICNTTLNNEIRKLEASIEVWSKVERMTKKNGDDFAAFKKAFPHCVLRGYFMNNEIVVDYDLCSPYSYTDIYSIWIKIPSELDTYTNDYASLNAMSKSDIERQIKEKISEWQTKLEHDKKIRDNKVIENVCNELTDSLEQIKNDVEPLKDTCVMSTLMEQLRRYF